MMVLPVSYFATFSVVNENTSLLIQGDTINIDLILCEDTK